MLKGFFAPGFGHCATSEHLDTKTKKRALSTPSFIRTQGFVKASDVDLKHSDDKYCYHVVNTDSCFNVFIIIVMRSEAASSAGLHHSAQCLHIASCDIVKPIVLLSLLLSPLQTA